MPSSSLKCFWSILSINFLFSCKVIKNICLRATNEHRGRQKKYRNQLQTLKKSNRSGLKGMYRMWIQSPPPPPHRVFRERTCETGFTRPGNVPSVVPALRHGHRLFFSFFFSETDVCCERGPPFRWLTEVLLFYCPLSPPISVRVNERTGSWCVS